MGGREVVGPSGPRAGHGGRCKAASGYVRTDMNGDGHTIS